jgi:glutathione S-transferase
MYLALKEIEGISIELVDLLAGESRTPDFLEKNPFGTVPVLETDCGRYIGDSFAIMHYLEDIFPDPPMRGVSESERRRVDIQCFLIDEFLHFASLSVSHTHPYLSRRRDYGQLHEIDIVTSGLWRKRLEQISLVMNDSSFLAGDQPSIPDCMLFQAFQTMRALFGVFIPAHLIRMLRWYDRCLAIPRTPPLQFPEVIINECIARAGARF